MTCKSPHILTVCSVQEEEEEEDCPGVKGGLDVAKISRCYQRKYGTSTRSNLAKYLLLYVISVLQCSNTTYDLLTNILKELDICLF